MIESDLSIAPETGSSRPKKILVIDDDPDIVRILRYMLRDAGYTVIYAYNGTDGMHKARVEKPDLVLTDLAMPKMSGVEVIEVLHGDPVTQGIPILAVTAHAWDTIMQAAHQVGCVGYVAKPFTREQLLHQVRKRFEPAVEEEADDAPPEPALPEGRFRLRA